MGLIKMQVKKNMPYCLIFLEMRDHLGDMDFKVTGTRDGITATQMDIKVDGYHSKSWKKRYCKQKKVANIFLTS